MIGVLCSQPFEKSRLARSEIWRVHVLAFVLERVGPCRVGRQLFTNRSKCEELKNAVLAAMSKLGMPSPAEK